MKQVDMITCFCGGDFHSILDERASSLSCRLNIEDDIGLYCYEDLIAVAKIETNEFLIINRIDETNVMYQLLSKIKRELLDLSVNYICKNDFNIVGYY